MSGKSGFRGEVTAVGITNVISASYTRPSNTTTYTAGDVVANSTTVATILTFTGMTTFPGGGGTIEAATLIDSTAESTKPDLDLYLFDTPVVMEQDNAAWDPSDAEMETCLGVIPFAGSAFKVGAVGANGIIHVQSIRLPFTCVTDDKNLYGILVARNAYVPVSAEKFTVRLHVRQD